MSINRVNFAPIAQGGDTPTAALVKLDGNDADLDARVDVIKQTSDAALPKAGGTVTGALTVNGQVTFGAQLNVSAPVVTAGSTLTLGAKGTSGRVDIYPNTDTTAGRASIVSSGQLQLDGTLQAKGCITRAGTNGAVGGNAYNIGWSNIASLYIDTAFIGNFAFANSDPRIKKDVVHLDSAQDGDADIERVLLMRPCTWTYANVGLWYEDGITRRSFLSTEMQDIDPLLAPGDRNATTEDGGIIPLNLNSDAILSAVVGALRREITLRRDLEARVAALEAAK